MVKLSPLIEVSELLTTKSEHFRIRIREKIAQKKQESVALLTSLHRIDLESPGSTPGRCYCTGTSCHPPDQPDLRDIDAFEIDFIDNSLENFYTRMNRFIYSKSYK